MPAVSGSPTQLAASVTTLANLAGLPDDAYKDGDFAYVQSTRATYQLDRASAATPSSVAVDTFSGNGQWVFFQASSSWGSQATWYIDPAAGDDENDGATTTTAIATWAEFRRRIKTFTTSITVTIRGDLTEPLTGDFESTSSANSFTVIGEAVVLATATGTAFTAPVRSGAQAMGTMSAGNITDFTAYDGKMLRTGTIYAPILGVSGVAPNVAPLLPYWASEALSNSPPAPGVAVEILQLIEVPSMQITISSAPLFVRFLKFTSTSFQQSSFSRADNPYGITYSACEFVRAVGTLSDTFYVGCLLTGTGGLYPYAPISFIGGGSKARGLTTLIDSASAVTFQGFIINGNNTVAVGLGVGGGANYQLLAQVGSSSGSYGLGVFNCTSHGVSLTSGAFASFQSLFGSGNVGYGLYIHYGAQCWLATTPTITGTAGELQFCGAGTAIPPLVGGAAVPVAEALTTWAQWAGGNFAKRVTNYGNSTSLIGA